MPEKSLSDKLGIKIGANIAIINAPKHYDELIGGWPIGASVSRKLDETFTFIHYFSKSKDQLAGAFLELMKHMDKNGMLWVSWQKGSAALNENIVRELGLKAGLVDVKVVSVDEGWSALKFVYRLVDRPS